MCLGFMSFRAPPAALKQKNLHNSPNFINRNIGVLSGRLLSLEGVNKTFIIWVELSSVRLRDVVAAAAIV